jgi:hypothetical protein
MKQVMFAYALLTSIQAAEYTAPDRSFSISVPTGWRVRVAEPFTIVEPANGGDDRIMAGAGVATANTIQELSQQAMQLAGQLLPGARLSASPKFAQIGAMPSAEQEYQTPMLAAWNGMVLKDGFYFGVLAMAKAGQVDSARQKGREILQSLRFQGVPRNPRLESMLLGSWSKESAKSYRVGVRDTSNYSASWIITFLPGNRFRSVMESYFDTSSEIYRGGGNVGAANNHTGVYRIFGNTLVADIDGGGRQTYALEVYPGSGGLKLNGQLFLRQ